MNALARNMDAQNVGELLSVAVKLSPNAEVWSDLLSSKYAQHSALVTTTEATYGADLEASEQIVLRDANEIQLMIANAYAGLSIPQLTISSNSGTQTFFNLQGLALMQANSWLAKARAAAKTGDLRPAYHSVYRGLDILLKNAKWT